MKDAEVAKQVIRHYARTATRGGLEEMLKMAASEPGMTLRLLDGEVIHPASVAVMADHHRGSQPVLVKSAQHRGRRAADRAVEVTARVVPRAGQARFFPDGGRSVS